MLNAWLPLVLAALPSAGPAVVDHQITATLDPAAGTLAVTDRITLPAGWEGRSFGLYKDLVPDGLELAGQQAPEVAGSIDHDAMTPMWRAWAAPAGERTFTVRYRGHLVMPPEQEPEEYARSFQRTVGTIQAEGVYLSAASGWIPRFGDELLTFSLEVKGLPEGWSALSEGSETKTGWRSTVPLDDVHLIAGPFWRREQKVGQDKRVNAIALLRSEDPALAGRYLDVTGRYLAMYEEMIGPYPYDKFALVENFWETGYGMPSFTLLGPQVIRFPFILHSSYPHELLHNWWGNSVFLDPGSGNWCEGLTAYLADHLVAEQRGQGAEHRRRILSKYRDFVTAENDFPLKDFRGRNSPSSEAVGYGKWAMIAHMLRLELGDEKLKEALRSFFRDHRHQRAGFAELQAAFEAQAGHSLDGFFRAWIDRPGAPLVRWWAANVRRDPRGQHSVEIILEQAPPELGGAEPMPMVVPVLATLADGTTTELKVPFAVGERFSTLRANTAGRVVQLDIDPRFDVFRRLDSLETPPTLSVALGEAKGLMVLPTFASDKELAAWRDFARKVCKPGACEVKTDKAVRTLPRDRAVWVLGYGNALRASAIVGASRYGARYDDGSFSPTGDRDAPSNGDRATTLAFRHPRNPASALVFVGSHKTEAIAGLARKLPHYGKYSYLQFTGDAPDNVVKGTWPTIASPMRVVLEGRPREPRLRPRPALAELPPPFDGERMLAFARGLADPRWQGRGVATAGNPQALAAAQQRLLEAGLEVERQCFTVDDGPFQGRELCNLVARIPGRDPRLAPVVLGAHVDHLGVVNGKVHPGADDNASGVAVLVEAARALAAEGPFPRGVELVVFNGEEIGLKGSRHYLSATKTKPFAMVNLDTVGRAGGRPFLVFGHESASEWVHIFRGIGFVSGVKTQMGAEGLAASDHEAFLEAKVPAVHLFSGPTPDYHRPSDTADKLEATSLVQAAILAKETVSYLAGRTDPLSSTLDGAAPPKRAGGERKVSLGTVPDFAFPGPGVRITGVTKGSPAEAAGLQAGDIVLELGARKLNGLRDLSDALKAAQAGDKLKLVYTRGGERRTTEVTLVSR